MPRDNSADSIQYRRLVNRRRFLQSAGIGATLGLAGCLGSDDSGDGGSGDSSSGDSNADNGGSDADESSDELDLSGVTIEYWTLFGGGDGAAMEAITNEVNGNVDYTIDRQRVPWSEYYDRLFTSLTGGEGPDVAIVHTERLIEYEDLVEPLDGRISTDPYLDDIVEMGHRNGNFLAAPLDTHPYGLYYNREVFEEAGLDPDDPPNTPERFAECANAIRDNTDHWPAQIHSGFWSFALFNTWVESMDGQLLTDDLEPAFNDDAGQHAAEFYHDVFIENEWAPSDSDTGWEAWQRGEAGMVFEGTWHVGVLDEVEFEWSMTKPFVLPNHEQAYTWANSHLLMVPADSGRTEEERAAAVDFITRLTQDHNHEWGINAGHLPASKAALESGALQESERWEQTLETYSEMAEDGQLAYMPVTPSNAEFHDAVFTELNEIRFGNKSVEEALNAAEETVNIVFD